jgi:signal transduction histidine kinase
MVPLVSGGRTVGVISLMRSEPGSEYRQADLALAQELANRAALAVENARLYTAEQEARAEAQAQRDRLCEAVAVRDTFLSVASHELKTPLTPLALRLQSLEKVAETYLGSSLADQVKAHTSLAMKQVRKLSDLVNDLLDVSRIAAGRLKLEQEETDVAQLVREAVARLETEASKAGSQVTLRAPESLVMDTARLRLDQVITNLVDNAIKYGAGKPIEIQLTSSGQQTVLSVTDRGIGIAPKDLSRIFERFERAASDRNYGGLGLGLYITRTIVEGLGGAIMVHSEPGLGATFTVTLPKAIRG